MTLEDSISHLRFLKSVERTSIVASKAQQEISQTLRTLILQHTSYASPEAYARQLVSGSRRNRIQ